MSELGYLSCLFCTKVLPGSPIANIVKDEDKIAVIAKLEGGETESGSILSGTGAEEDVPILEDLKAIFIVRKLLDLSEEQCEQYLQRKMEGYPSPGSWFKVCGKCNGVVKECYQTYRQIRRLEGNLKGMKMQLVKLMQDTNCQKRRTKRLLVDDIRKSVLDLAGVTQRVSAKKEEVDWDASQPSASGLEKITRRKRKTAMASESTPVDLPDDFNEQCSPASLPDIGNDSDWSPVTKREKFEELVPGRRLRDRQSERCSEKVLPVEDDKNDKSIILISGEAMDIELNATKLNAGSDKKDAKVQTRRTIYRCKQCPAAFTILKNSRKHHNLHSNGTGVKCPHCGWLCEKEKLKLHLTLKHAIKSLYIRTKRLVKLKLPNGSEHRLLTKAPGEEVPYYCEHCHMIFISAPLLQNHHLKYHSGKELVPCQHCSAEFISKQLLELHMEEKHPTVKRTDYKTATNDSTLSCSHCSELFVSKLKLDFHIAKIHPLTLLKCKMCDYQGKKYSLLDNHIMRKHSTGKFVCDMCSKILISMSALKRHVSAYHYKEAGLNPIKCPRAGCPSVFTSSITLENHIQYVHEKVKELCCEHCGKAFARNSELNKHVLLHTVPRELQYKKGPFTCKYCPTALFNVRQGLYYHMKKAHSDKYVSRCGKCGKGYAIPSVLHQHEKNCNGERNS